HGLVTRDAEVSGLDLAISPGEVIAVSGPPRATTALVEHLVGLRDPRKGAIVIDGIDLRDAHLPLLRERIALVREPEVWPRSVLENVRAVGRVVSVSRVWEALEIVGLAHIVRGLPEGLH